METGVEGFKVVAGEVLECGEVYLGLRYLVGVFKEEVAVDIPTGEQGVAEAGEVGVVGVALHLDEGVAHPYGDEGGDAAADVDEHVENLETGVALVAVFGVVIELAHDCLEVSFEESVTERDHKQRAQGNPLGGDEGGNCQEGVAQTHYDESGDDGALVVLGLVGNHASHEGEDVDGAVECRVEGTGLTSVEVELRHEEQRQDGHHNVEAEAFAHVAQGRGNQSFGLVLKHSSMKLVCYLISRLSGFLGFLQLLEGQGVDADLLYHREQAVGTGRREVFRQADAVDEVEVCVEDFLGGVAREDIDEH